MCVRDESRVCKINGSTFEMPGVEGGERLDHLEHTPLYENEQKRRGKHLMETTDQLNVDTC